MDEPRLSDGPAPDQRAEILAKGAETHRHLCPRQVLGARMAWAAAGWLDLEVPRDDKRLLVIAETDGCFVSGIEAAAGVRVSARTLRILDVGKIAATFADVRTERAVRLAPKAGVRAAAAAHADPDAPGRWQAMLVGYQRMPANDLLAALEVALHPSAAELRARPHVRVDCVRCGEEVINAREVLTPDGPLCRPCANVEGARYYRVVTR